MSKVANKCSI